jgi:hypothetical protein
MKHLIFFFSVFTNILYCQNKVIDTIFINQYKSSQIIFEEETIIDFIDVGTADLHVTNKHIDNVVILQSIVGQSDFVNTNMFIKTKNSGIYNFILSFSEKPKEYTYFIKKDNNNTVKYDTKNSSATTIPAASKNILIDNIINKKTSAYKPSTSVITDTKAEFFGIFFFNKKLYYKLKITNSSFLDYKIKDYFVYVRNVKSRKTADSERSILPIKIHANFDIIKGKKEEFIVLEFDQFSLNKKEELIIEIKEGSNGQRDFKIIIPHYITNTPIVL